MPDPEKLDLTGDNPAQDRTAQTVDRAVLGTTATSGRWRTILFIVLFIVLVGGLFAFVMR
jgi:hypothetical protein